MQWVFFENDLNSPSWWFFPNKHLCHIDTYKVWCFLGWVDKNSPFSENHWALKFPFPDSEWNHQWSSEHSHICREHQEQHLRGGWFGLDCNGSWTPHLTHPVWCPMKKNGGTPEKLAFPFKGGTFTPLFVFGRISTCTTFLRCADRKKPGGKQLHSSLPATVFRHHLLLPLEVGR